MMSGSCSSTKKICRFAKEYGMSSGEMKTVSVDNARVLLLYATSLGIQANDMYRGTSFNESLLNTPEARISVDEYLDMWKAAAIMSKDACFGLHFGDAAGNMQRGNILCAVMMNCPTVEEGIGRFIRYYCLMSDLIKPLLRLEGEHSRFTWTTEIADVKSDLHLQDSLLVMLASVLRCLAGDRARIVEARLEHVQPKESEDYRLIFDAPVLFGQSNTELIIDRQILAEPVFMANGALLRAYEKVAEAFLQKISSTRIWTTKVLTSLGREMFDGDKPSIEMVAGDLAVSTRNLQYRLKEEGTTFQKLLNHVRKELAIAYMSKSDVSLFDIAFLLGFSEQSSFNHAFRKWTGMRPSEYRNKAISASSEKLFAVTG
jgi:AraC-like DNA-binding protein